MINSINFKAQSTRKNNQISFQGLKENLRLGERVLKEFKKEYPYLRSDTFLCLHRYQVRKLGPIKYDGILQNASGAIVGCSKEIKAARTKIKSIFMTSEIPINFLNYISMIKRYIIANKFANCGEISDIIQVKLLEKGEKSRCVNIKITEAVEKRAERGFGDHSFTVFGLKRGAIMTMPNTWGREAVIIDGWSNTVLPAKEALEHFKCILDFNPKKDTLVFKEDNEAYAKEIDMIAMKNRIRMKTKPALLLCDL